jgi:hypothetical protein
MRWKPWSDEVIEAAIASDSDEADLDDDWLDHAKIVRFPDNELGNET